MKKVLLRTILLIIIIFGGLFLVRPLANSNEDIFQNEVQLNSNRATSSIKNKLVPPVFYIAQIDLSKLNLYSEYVLLTDLNQNIFYEKNSEQIMYPASLTKMLTAIVAIETLPSLHEIIKIDSNMFQRLFEANAALAGFFPNEEVTAKDLLYGTMLPSGAEATIALTEYIAGSEEAYVELMNEKANEIGMENSHFMNATGLHHPEHYSTAEDMAILVQYAIQNPVFYEIFTSPRYSTGPSNMHPEGITFTSTMFRRMDNPQFGIGEILGGKTGFTNEAGQCLASIAEINGEIFILITTGANGNHYTEPFHILDAFHVYQELQNQINELY